MCGADVYEDDDMAAVGRALMIAIDRETADRNGPLFGWHPADCPSEVVGDLVKMLLQAHTITGDMVETACAAYTTEYCGGEAEWPDGWNPARADDHRAAIRAAIRAARAVSADLRKTVRGAIETSYREDLLYDQSVDVVPAAITAAGYAIVPREPTEAMVEAAWLASSTWGIGEAAGQWFVSDTHSGGTTVEMIGSRDGAVAEMNARNTAASIRAALATGAGHEA